MSELRKRADSPILLVGHKFSLYSGKARSYLRHKRIPFNESSALADRRRAEQCVGRRVIPVIFTPEGDCVQDTTQIIDFLEQRFPEQSVYPEGVWQRLVALLFEVYGDEWLLLPAMHYRWHYKRDNLAYVLRNFGDILKPGWPRYLRPIGGFPKAMIFGTLYKILLGRSRANIVEIEKSYEAFLGDFERHLEDHSFLLGERPCIGDFGLIGPLYAHLYRDPYPGKLMRRKAPRVAAWVERMQEPSTFDGELLSGDQVPETLYPLLRRMFKEQMPVLTDTLQRVGAWVAEHPDAERIPRFIGRHDFYLGDVKARRMVMPFAQWMFQRPLMHYQSLSSVERVNIDPLLAELGGLEGLSQTAEVTLAVKNYRLVIKRVEPNFSRENRFDPS